MTKLFIALIFSFTLFFSEKIQAQIVTSDEAFLLPQTVFVGDSGRLIVPLGVEYSLVEAFVWDTRELYSSEKIEQTDELEILRIELEKRGAVIRLLIDFIPYSPGLLIFPPLEISPENELIIQDLEVHIASILNPARMSLAETAAPLVQPGTGLLVYGSIGIILLLIFLGIAGTVLGRRHFNDIFNRIRQRYLLRKMISFLRRLGQDCSRGELSDAHQYLGLLSGEFREFLSFFTGLNCRSLSAGEFLEFSSDEIPMQNDLYRVFRNWDILRFSGLEIQISHVKDAVKDAGEIIFTLYKAEKEKKLFSSKTDKQNEQSVNTSEVLAGEAL